MLTPHNATILIVDDSPENLLVLTELLSPHYRVLAAQSGEKCLRIVSADPKPDLILLDVMMPGMDGYEVCRQLQQDPQTRNIPIIFLTAKASVEDEEFGLGLGAVDYITKPINGEIVKARVRNHLKFRRVVKTVTIDEPEDERMAKMTERQREIFRWVQEGKTNWEIARIIGCSEENVKYHMKNILRIMGSYNRTQAVASHQRKKAAHD